MKFLPWTSLLLTLLCAHTALARDEIIELPIQGGMAIADSQGALSGLKMRSWDGTDRSQGAAGPVTR